MVAMKFFRLKVIEFFQERIEKAYLICYLTGNSVVLIGKTLISAICGSQTYKQLK